MNLSDTQSPESMFCLNLPAPQIPAQRVLPLSSHPSGLCLSYTPLNMLRPSFEMRAKQGCAVIGVSTSSGGVFEGSKDCLLAQRRDKDLRSKTEQTRTIH